MTERLRGSAAHSCSGSVPKTRSRTRPDGCWDWARLPTVMPLVRVERPESRSMVPASAPSSVVLPVPLRPTTPIRSPAVTPSDTRSSSGRSP